MSIMERIVSDLKAAMVARDAVRLGTLRLMRAELLKAEKEKGETPDDPRAIAVLQKMLKQRQESVEQYSAAGRDDLAQAERAEAAVIQTYLPAAMDDDAIDAVIDAVLAEMGPLAANQMGQVMGPLMARLKATGQLFDGKTVNQRVRAKLGG